MRSMVICAVLGCVTAIASFSRAQEKSLVEQERALLAERLELAQKNYELMLEITGQSGGNLEALLQAEARVAAARLDMAKTARERITALEEAVKVATATVDLMQRMQDTGRVPVTQVLTAKYELATAKLALVREQRKPTARPAGR